MRFLVVLFSLFVCGSVLAGCTVQNPTPQVQTTPTPVAVDSSNETRAYTLDTVALHKTKEDCWMSIDGKVYNVTPITSSGTHPGGPMILQGCGTDATRLFNNRPNNKGPHPEEVKTTLQDYYIGELEQ